jgi:hypothetical protein
MFDWMMTDVCGLVNTGWASAGAMQQMTSATNFWTPSYNMSVGGPFGNAIRYPNLATYVSLARIDYAIDFTKSLTLFAYFRIYINTGNICLIEFAPSTTFSGNVGPHWWYAMGGLYFNFRKSLFFQVINFGSR